MVMIAIKQQNFHGYTMFKQDICFGADKNKNVMYICYCSVKGKIRGLFSLCGDKQKGRHTLCLSLS